MAIETHNKVRVIAAFAAFVLVASFSACSKKQKGTAAGAVVGAAAGAGIGAAAGGGEGAAIGGVTGAIGGGILGNILSEDDGK